jgi:hypothetical protein
MSSTQEATRDTLSVSTTKPVATTEPVYETEPVRGVGGAVVAGTLMLIGGSFWFLEGLAGILNSGFYRPVADYYSIDGTTWGWIHLLFGVIFLAAGLAVFSGRAWARWTGITIASISAIVNFFFIPWAPIWAITIIAIDLWIIHDLFVYRRQDF